MVTRYRESPFDVVKNLRLVAGGIHPKAASTDDSRRTVDPREGNNPYAPSVDTPSLTPTVGSEALMGLGDVSKAYQLAATRGDKRISDTKRRVSELVKLDPTNPLALLVTMLGAREEALTTQELDKLRGKDARNEAKKKRDKKFEAEIKLFKFQDEIGELLTSKYGGSREKMMKAYNEDREGFFKDLQGIANKITASEAKDYTGLIANFERTQTGLNTLLSAAGAYTTIDEYLSAVKADESKRVPKLDDYIGYYRIVEDMVGTISKKYGPPTGQELKDLKGATKNLNKAGEELKKTAPPTGETETKDDKTIIAKKLKEALGGKKGIKLERQTDGAIKTPPQEGYKTEDEANKVHKALGNPSDWVVRQNQTGQWVILPLKESSPLGTYEDKAQMEEEFRVTLPPLTAKIVGQTNEGRDIYEDVKGGRASERSTTFQTPSGHWFNFPTIFGGRIVSEDEAVEIFMENGGVDPETNINYGEKPYSTQEEAVKAAEARSSGIEEFSTSDIPLVPNQFYEEEDGVNPALAPTRKTDQLKREKDDYRDYDSRPPIGIPQQPDGKIIKEELNDLAKTLLPKGATTSKEVAQLEKDIKVIDKLIEDGVIAETDPTGVSNRYTGGVTIVTEGAELPIELEDLSGAVDARRSKERNELFDRTMGKPSVDPLADLREAPVADEFIRKDQSLGSYGGVNLDNIEQGTRQKKDDGVYDATLDTDLRKKMALDNPVGKFIKSLTVENAKKAYKWAEGKAGIVADSIRAWHRKNMEALKPYESPPLDNTIPVDPDAPDNFDIRNYIPFGSNTPDKDLRGRPLPNMPVGTGQQGQPQQVVSLPEELRGGPTPAGTKKRGQFAGMAIPELMPNVGFGGPDTSGGGQAIEEDKNKTVDEITPEYKKSMVEHWRQNPVTESLIQTESSGDAKAVGYKIKWDDGKGKFVHVKDKHGEKIPQSYGLMQMTLSTAAATDWGKKIFKGKSKEERVQLLYDPYNNMKMSREFTDKLKKQFDENKYTKDWDEIDKNILVGMAYNWKGEGLSKKVIDVIKPEKFQDILYKASKFGIKIPKQTRRQIRVFRKKLGNFNF